LLKSRISLSTNRFTLLVGHSWSPNSRRLSTHERRIQDKLMRERYVVAAPAGVIVTGLGRTPSGVATKSYFGSCPSLIRHVTFAMIHGVSRHRVSERRALNDAVSAMNVEIEVIETIEPDYLDFETVCQALGNVGKGKRQQLVHVGTINGHKIGERTVFAWRKCGGSPRCAGAPTREMCCRAVGIDRCSPGSIEVVHAAASSSDAEVRAEFMVGRPTVSVIGRREMQSALVVGSKRVLP
jgi:hypothetical protein